MTVEELVELAVTVGSEDHQIDWGMLCVEESEVYRLMAAHVLELNSTRNESLEVLMAVVTHLLVENFVLNARLIEATRL